MQNQMILSDRNFKVVLIGIKRKYIVVENVRSK